MVNVTKMHESDSRRIPDKSEWSAFATITTFDRGKPTSHKWKKENALVSKKTTTFTPSSLFVESLIDQLCKLFEKDPVSQIKLYDLICHKLYEMKLIDKTYKVEEFQFMRSYYQRALCHLLTISNSPALDSKLETFLNQSPSSLALPPLTKSIIFDWSRYQNEFEEIEFIARGGFGRVFRVKNKVDGCEYAIKKICLRYRSKEQFIQSLREVRTLANLDHCNIVAYKAAWFEPLTGLITEEESSGSTGSKISPELEPSDPDDDIPESSISERESKDEAEDDSGNIVFASKYEEVSEEQSNIQSNLKLQEKISHVLLEGDHDASNKEDASSIYNVNEIKPLNSSLTKKSLCDHNSRSNNKGCRGHKFLGSQRGIEYAVLHIQMQLCKESLREWLNFRNEALQLSNMQLITDKVGSDQLDDKSKRSLKFHLDSDSVSTALHIFLKILNGVEYVHSMGIVHHDLKPSNIFVEGFEYRPSNCKTEREKAFSEQGAESLLRGRETKHGSQLRVGDFGLACHLTHPSSTVNIENKDSGGLKDEALAVIPTHLLEKGDCLVQTGHHALSDERGEAKQKEIIGTKLYAAPEQLEGHCNPKSDMFSLGIILFELLYPFFTGMERIKVISALRISGNTPADFEHQYPLLAPLIKDLLSHNPSSRPSIKELIQMLEPILAGCRGNIKSGLEGGVCLNDNSLIEDDACCQEAQSKEVSQISYCEYQQHQHRELDRISNHTWEEISIKETQVTHTSCSSYTCHVLREKQEEVITKLQQENFKKDETIKELRHQILQLQNTSKNIGNLKDDTSN